MSTAMTPNDVIMVHCQEIPESICVETRFVPPSGIPKNVDQLITNTGIFELGKDGQSTSAQTMPSISKPPSFSTRCFPNTVINTSNQQCQILQQTQHPTNSFVALSAPLPNLQNNVYTNLSVTGDLLRPAVVTQLNNTSQMPSFVLNNTGLNAPQVGSSVTQNNSIIARSYNEQMQQTEISAFNSKSVAIQCNLEDEFEDLDVEWPAGTTDLCEDTEMESFLRFIKDNSIQHKNYKECLICGELCKSNNYFYGHMVVHRGPKALCYKCGKYLEHENLLHQHKCQREEQLAKAFLKCPHFSCDVTAISRLELYDHINEHTYSKFYKCSSCRKRFCTGQEFLRHILMRATCYTSAKMRHFRWYNLESQKDRLCRVRVFTLFTNKKRTTLVKSFLSQRAQKRGVCKICFKTIRNKFVYNHHRLICIAAFKRRLSKKR